MQNQNDTATETAKELVPLSQLIEEGIELPEVDGLEKTYHFFDWDYPGGDAYGSVGTLTGCCATGLAILAALKRRGLWISNGYGGAANSYVSPDLPDESGASLLFETVGYNPYEQPVLRALRDGERHYRAYEGPGMGIEDDEVRCFLQYEIDDYNADHTWQETAEWLKGMGL